MTKESPPRAELKYTQEELELLEDMVGTTTFVTIAKKLNRTPLAIERQLTRMGLINTKLESGLLSANELCNALQVHSKVLMRLKKQFNLPLRRKSLRYGCGKYNSWLINPEEFWRWAKKHKQEVNWAKYVAGSIIPEPDWLQAAIRVQMDTLPPKRKQVWSPEDDNLLWQLFYSRGMKQKDIAAELGRSLHGVEKRLKRLRTLRKEGHK